MQETFTWVYNVIENCNSDFHFQCSDVLISLFRVQYGDNVFGQVKLTFILVIPLGEREKVGGTMTLGTGLSCCCCSAVCMV